MKTFGFIPKASCIAGILGLLLFCSTNFAAAEDSNSWQHELSIYGWYAGIGGTVDVVDALGSGQDYSVDASDIIENLEMIFMGGWVSKKDKLSIIADVVYMDVGDSSNNVEFDLASWVVNTGVGYDLVQNESVNLAVVGGVRYMSVEPTVKVRGLKTSQSDDILDGLVGLRGTVNFTKNWFLPFYADIGTGGSDLSYQLFTGLGYRFGWGDIRLGYRYLKFEMDDDALMKDLDMSGPVLGVGFRF